VLLRNATGIIMQFHSFVTVAFAAAIFAGCSTHSGADVSHPAAPPEAGQLGVQFSPAGLSPGHNSLYFALVRLDKSGRAVVEENPGLQTEVRFYAERSPNGHPDASTRATFLKEGTSFVSASGQTERANFVAELVVPHVQGGALEFVVRQPSTGEVVIHAPVRVASESSR